MPSARTISCWYALSSNSSDSNVTEKVRSRSGLMRLTAAVMIEESSPPLRYAPTGTSAAQPDTGGVEQQFAQLLGDGAGAAAVAAVSVGGVRIVSSSTAAP